MRSLCLSPLNKSKRERSLHPYLILKWSNHQRADGTALHIRGVYSRVQLPARFAGVNYTANWEKEARAHAARASR
jgi:hypothetical protein